MTDVPVADAPLGPTQRRVRYIDVLRGVAILGILPVNAETFAYPMMLSMTRSFPPGGDGLDALAHAAVHALFRYKFITLFSFLFGVGIGIMHTRSQARGVGYGGLMGRRLGALWLFGILHATLLWWGDIVSYYAPIGLALCWLISVSPKPLAAIGAALISLPGLCLCGAGALVAASLGGGELAAGSIQALDVEAGRALAAGGWGEFVANTIGHDANLEYVVYSEGSWAQITLMRALTWVGIMPMALVVFGPRIAGLMLIGMACAKSNWFLDPGSADGRRRFRWMLGIGLAVGILFTTPSVAFYARETYTPQLQALWEGLNYVGSLGLSAAILASVALVTAWRPDAWWTKPFAAVGRTAFSNYIGQTVVMTGLFYSYGLGWYGQVGRAELFGLVAAVWAAQLLVSPLWLRFFRMGPIEWLWRSLTYWRPQPLLRRPGQR